MLSADSPAPPPGCGSRPDGTPGPAVAKPSSPWFGRPVGSVRLPAGWVAGVVAVFVASRALACAWGLKFDVTPLYCYWQVADPALLKIRLLETLFYLHSQPPFYNLLGGLALKLAGVCGPAVTLGAVFHALGLAAGVALVRLLANLGIRPLPAFAVTCAYMLTPWVVLHEHTFFYEHLLSSFLLLGLGSASAYLRHRSLASLWLSAAWFCLCCLTTASFHLVWLAVVLGGICWAAREGRRAAWVGVGAALLSVGSLHVKNHLVFGSSDLSPGFAYPNLALSVIGGVPRPLVDELEAAGVISGLYRTAFMEPTPEVVRQLDRPWGIAVLDQHRWSDGTTINRYCYLYLAVARQLQRDALAVLARYPRYFLVPLRQHLAYYVRPAGDYLPYLDLTRLSVHAQAYRRWVDRYVLLQPRPGMPAWALVVGLPAALLGGCLIGYQDLRQRRDPGRAALVFVMVFTVLYIALTMVPLSVAEQNRYRSRADSFSLVLLTLGASELWRRGRLHGRPTGQPAR